MVKTQLVSTGIILALLSSNIITGNQYIKDSKEYEMKSSIQSKIIEHMDTKERKQVQQIRKNSNKINNLNQQIDQLKQENNALQQDKEELEKKLAIKEEADNTKEYFTVTAYTSGKESTGKSPGDRGYEVTASGEKVEDGVTIACPSSLLFGTKVNIETIGIRVCMDRGGAITGNRIDLYVGSLAQAIQFGSKRLLVEILS